MEIMITFKVIQYNNIQDLLSLLRQWLEKEKIVDEKNETIEEKEELKNILDTFINFSVVN